VGQLQTTCTGLEDITQRQNLDNWNPAHPGQEGGTIPLMTQRKACDWCNSCDWCCVGPVIGGTGHCVMRGPQPFMCHIHIT
jgi:hypothetical protein